MPNRLFFITFFLLCHLSVSRFLPTTFVWQLQLKEMHTTQGFDFSQGLYYFDYSCAPAFCSRQENNVVYSVWRNAARVDVPYNIFYAFDGLLSAEFLNNTNRAVTVAKLGAYNNSFWPPDYLASACELISSNVTLDNEFGGKFNDGKSGLDQFKCNILNNPNVTAFVSSEKQELVRLVVGKLLPMWEFQIWDVVAMQRFESPFPKSFLAPPYFQ